MSPSFSIVADEDVKQLPVVSETVAQRVQRLQTEAKSLARDHVAAFERELIHLQAMSVEIAAGGEAYHGGAREFARSLTEDLEHRIGTLQAIRARN